MVSIKEELHAIDDLSTSRSILASERTLLAYIRTGLTMIIVGMTLIKLFDTILIRQLGWLFIPAGIGLMFMGLVRHKKRKIRIRREEAKYGAH